MSDEKGSEAAPERERRVTSETERRRRVARGKLVAAVLVAMPGFYAAVRAQYAANDADVKTEVVVRDRQEGDLRKHFESLRREVEAFRKAAVTHKELLEVVVKLRDREKVYTPRSPRRRTEATAREKELESKLEDLRKREETAIAAKARAEVVQRRLPTLKSAKAVRKAVRADF